MYFNINTKSDITKIKHTIFLFFKATFKSGNGYAVDSSSALSSLKLYYSISYNSINSIIQ